jgi:hypothetical protein
MSFWRVEIIDPAAGQTYLEAGRLVLGRAWQPSTNFDIGGTPLAFDPTDVVAQTPSGHTFTDRRAGSPPRLFNIIITAANRREVMDGIAEIQRLRGTWGDVICCLDPGETTDFHLLSMQGRLTQGGQFPSPALFDASGYTWGASILLREFL